MKNIKKIVGSVLVAGGLLLANTAFADDVEVIELESISTPNTEQKSDTPEYNVTESSKNDVMANRRMAERLITNALYTLQDFEGKHNYAEIERDFRNARAIVIFPEVISAGFFVGVGGGTGVMLARSKDGAWSYPTFYTYNQASLGVQFGGASSQMAMVVMNGKGLGALIADKLQAGASFKGAIGETGESVGVGATSNAKVDIKTYALSKGAFLGASLEGAKIEPDTNLNKAYYGRDDATTQSVIIEGLYANKHADSIRNYLNKFTYQYE